MEKMENSNQIADLAETMKSLASASELLGQERTLHAVIDHLEVRGAEKDELTVFERAIRSRLQAHQ